MLFIAILIVVIIGIVALIDSSAISDDDTGDRNTTSNSERRFLKHRSIRTYDIRGLQYRRDNWRPGKFLGYVISEQNNKHDKYAVGIYTLEGRLIGFVPRGNSRLYNTLLNSSVKKIPAWGNIEDYEWGGEVNNRGIVAIPVNYCDEDLQQLTDILFSIADRNPVKVGDIQSILDYSEWARSVQDQCNKLQVGSIIEAVPSEHKKTWISETVKLTKAMNTEGFKSLVHDDRSYLIRMSLTEYQSAQLMARANKLGVGMKGYIAPSP